MFIAITSYLANNSRLLILIILTILLLGLTSLMSMPKAEDPQFELPINIIEVLAPGMSPDIIESKVIKPIEQSLAMVDDIKNIETEIKQGSATFTVRSFYGTDPDESYDEVVRAVTRVQADFPSDVQATLFFKGSPTTVNVIQYAITHPDNDWQILQRNSKKLQEQLQSLSTVRRAEIWGLPQLVVRVELEQQKLIKHKISVQQVEQALAARGNDSHAGYIDNPSERYSITLSGEYRTFAELSTTLIKAEAGSQLLLSDVASINISHHKANNLSFLSDKPAVFVTAQLKMGENIYHFTQQTEEVLKQFQLTYVDTDVQTVFSQQESVNKRVSGFMSDLVSGLVLILICLLFFMGFKQSFWVSLALPLTICGSLTILVAMGIELQQMTIAGIIVALGLLVDNSLVVVEQYAKHQNNQQPPLETAKQVIKEVGQPLISGTLTTVLAFLPLLALQSDTGDFMRALPLTVIIALGVSLLVALIILPALLAIFGTSEHGKFTLSSVLNHFADGRYSNALRYGLKHPLIIVVIFIIAVIGAFSLFPKVGVSLFPKAEKNIVMVNLETPSHSSLQHTEKVTLELATQLEQHEMIKFAASTVGASSPRIYYNHVPKRGVTNFAQIMLVTEEYNAEKIQGLIESIRHDYRDFSQGKVNVYEFQQGPVTDRPITVRLLGDDLAQLTARSIEIEEYLKAQDKVIEVRNISNQPGLSYSVEVDQIKAKQANIDLYQAEQQIRSLIDGKAIGQITDRYGESFPIVVVGTKFEVEKLTDLYLINQLNQAVPLSQFASVSLNKLTAPFYHYQRGRMQSISADVLPSGNVATTTEQLIEHLESLSWTDGMSYKIGGEEEARKENFGGLSQIMIVVVLGVFVLLFVQFHSFAQPSIIISLLPIAFAGAVIGMYSMNVSFSMMAFIGLISLIGIMVNDAIIIVDGFNRNCDQGAKPLEAMVKSASSRFTPVILTSLTTIVGLIPLTLYGGQLWQPMGTVIITGLLFTTLASLIWVPALTLKMSGFTHKKSHKM